MKKKEWMIFALVIILSLIIGIIALIINAYIHKDQVSQMAKIKKDMTLEESEIEIQPIEYDQWHYIERRFKERTNVLEVMEAHSYLEPYIEKMLEEGLGTDEIKSEMTFLIDAYLNEQTKIIADEVLKEYGEGYTRDDFNYLTSLANDTEIKQVLYLYEVQYLISKGIVLD